MNYLYETVVEGVWWRRGQQGAQVPSDVRWSVSLTCQLSLMSHSLMVLSQDALARTDWTGLKHRQLTGPSWPPRT